MVYLFGKVIIQILTLIWSSRVHSLRTMTESEQDALTRLENELERVQNSEKPAGKEIEYATYPSIC